jgi:preprotein translocase subunit SecF
VSFKQTLSDIFNEKTNFDFVGPRRKWFALSSLLILIGVGFLVGSGLNLGIDFEGGTSWQFEKRSGNVSTPDLRDALEPTGHEDAKILVLNGDSARVQTERVGRNEQLKVAEALANYGDIEREDVSISDVGPTWGREVSNKAVKALVFFFIAIAVYLSLRFEPKMALAAIAAVVHDVLITVGAYAVTGFEVTPATVIAFLTILGFSLYDTVVVFDKVKENSDNLTANSRTTYSAVVNRSMNEVLMRSLNTSFVAVLPVFSLLFVGSYMFGALTIKDFSLALFIGLLTGAYSSLFVATPVLAVLKEREPRYQAMRQRLEQGTHTKSGSGFASATSLEDAVDGGEGAPAEKAQVGAGPAVRRPPPSPRRTPKRPPPKRRKR